jgi:hypothetical protein
MSLITRDEFENTILGWDLFEHWNVSQENEEQVVLDLYDCYQKEGDLPVSDNLTLMIEGIREANQFESKLIDNEFSSQLGEETYKQGLKKLQKTVQALTVMEYDQQSLYWEMMKLPELHQKVRKQIDAIEESGHLLRACEMYYGIGDVIIGKQLVNQMWDNAREEDSAKAYAHLILDLRSMKTLSVKQKTHLINPICNEMLERFSFWDGIYFKVHGLNEHEKN